MIKKYKKKPIAIEALLVEINYSNLGEIIEFVGQENLCPIERRPNYVLKIKTLEGDMCVNFGDYIIKEPFDDERKFYPCKNEIFKKTYEEVE